ncbi:MAG: GntR family transcriptional regulator [Candidatus Limiplasma sp.]|nr:GntR family transcriptional regulator [Candidatus Limiplasma sp.]
MNKELDFSGRTQLYFQLYDILLGKITSGEYKPGELLPTENDLIQAYGISRITVRKAMDMLMNDGLIIKRRGYGTCVQPKKVEQTMKRVLHFSEEMQKKGFQSTTNMLSNEMLPASKIVADALQIAEGTPLVRVTRLRYANGVPLCLEIAHLVYERCPEVYGTDFSERSLRHFLEQKYQIVWTNATQKIYAINASAKVAAQLDVKENSALIYIERVSSTVDGKPGEYLQSYYRGDSYYLTTDLQA